MYEIDVEGLNQIRLLNTLRGEGINVRKARFISQSRMSITLRGKDLKKGVAILERLCYNYTINSVVGGMGKKLLRRLPLIIAVTLSVIAIFCSNLFVWGIEIEGADGAMRMEILDTIDSCGVGAFSPKSRVDEGEIARALREIDGVSSASVTLCGNVLTVSVLTSDEPLPPNIGGNSLKSDFDCVITRIVVESGTATVSVGDTVKRGDVLITGELFSTSDGSPIGETAVRGSAYGEVTFGYSFPVASSEILKRTGNRTERTALSIFGLTIGSDEPPYPLYEKETTRDKLSPLPIEVMHTVYYELSVTEYDGIEDFMSEKGDELSALFGKEFSQRYDMITMNGVAVLKAYFTAEILIGEI